MKLTQFGKEIRLLRISNDLTLKEMANYLGVSSAYVSSMETGSRKITDKFLESVFQYFEHKGLLTNDVKKKLCKAKNESIRYCFHKSGLTKEQFIKLKNYAGTL